MPIVKIAPGYVVNTENVEDVEEVEGTDAYSEKHVLINFKDFGHDISPEYTLDEITAAMNGGCYYRKEWTDEVGEIDVCVLHGNNSKHDPDKKGPYRECLTQDPYTTYNGYFYQYETPQKPKLEHSWEYQKLQQQEEEQRIREQMEREKNNPPIVLTPDMMPSHGEGSSTGLIYTDPPHRPWWKRLFGIY